MVTLTATTDATAHPRQAIERKRPSVGGGACRESGTDETRENLDTGPETGGGPEPPENPLLIDTPR